MQVQTINNNAPSFNALNITKEAKALIESEKGGKAKLKKYRKQLANSRWDLNIEFSKGYGSIKDSIYPYFGKDRSCCVIPCHLKDEFVMVYSSDAHSCDNEDDVVDCLKFSSSKRAKEVYETLEKHFFAKSANGDRKTPLQHLDWDVYAMNAFTEAEIVPQEQSPWAHFLHRDTKPKTTEQKNVPTEQTADIKKPSFTQRLKEAWNVLLGK